MRKAKRWRYFCDHCGRSGGRVDAMEKHERGCTKNPNRECGLCRHAGIGQEPLPDLLAALGCADKAGMEALREATESCPACILAAIRAYSYDTGPMPCNEFFSFDFKRELKEWWAEDRAHAAEINYY